MVVQRLTGLEHGRRTVRIARRIEREAELSFRAVASDGTWKRYAYPSELAGIIAADLRAGGWRVTWYSSLPSKM